MRIKPAILTLLLCLPLAGCDTTSTERLAYLESAIKNAQESVAAEKGTIAALEQQWIAARTAWADPNNGAPALQELAAKMKVLEDQVRAKVAAVASKEKEIEAYRAELAARVAAGATAADEVEMYGKGVGAIAPLLPPPFNAIVGGVAAAVAAAAGAYANGKREKAKASTAMAGVVSSVSTLLERKDLIMDPEKAKDVLAREQVKTPEAAVAVRRELDKMKEATCGA